MVNYQNGKIYKIINENNETIYIGSTVEKYLSTRYAKHKHKAPNHKIILIENYACNCKEELRKKEQQIIEEHNDLINIKKAYQSLEDFKYLKSIRDKKYREKHKEKIKENRKISYENKTDEFKKKKKNTISTKQNKTFRKN